MPTRHARPSIDREHPVQLSNIPVQSHPPVLQEIPVATTAGPGSTYADLAQPQARPVSDVPPARTSVYAPTTYAPQTDQGHSLDGGAHTAVPVKGGQNKLKKVPNVATHVAPATTHANVSPEGQLDPANVPPAGPAPLHDQANLPIHQEYGDAAQHPHTAHSDGARPATVSADQPGRKNKPVRDRPTATHVPTVLSTPPLLGAHNMAPEDGQTLSNVPVDNPDQSYPDGHSVAGTTAPSDGLAGRPNVLKKKPAHAGPSSKQGNSGQNPGARFEGADDHASQVNVHISNNGHDGKDGHEVNSQGNDRPQPPHIRVGHPSVSQDPSRPATLHLPTHDGKGGHEVGASRKSDDSRAKTPEEAFKDSEKLAGMSTRLAF